MSDLLKRVRSVFDFTIATKGRKVQKMEAPSIPKNWEKFGDSDDEWVEVVLPVTEDASCCIYKAKAGSIFPAHFHDTTERLFIMNQKGKINIKTNSRNETIEFPNGAFFDSKESHLVKFLTDTEILIIWSPKFERGWEANFSSL
jgi:hypothetical protein